MVLRVWGYHLAIATKFYKKYGEVPLILTFVFYYGKQQWTGPKSIAEIFSDFGLYRDVSLEGSFLFNLRDKDAQKLTKQGASTGPQLIMKGKSENDFCRLLDDLYPALQAHHLVNKQNIDYMASYDSHGPDGFLEKFAKFDKETANQYKNMFEAAIQRVTKKYEKLSILKKKEGMKEGTTKSKMEIAPNLLLQGVDIPIIEKSTGLSNEEIKALK